MQIVTNASANPTSLSRDHELSSLLASASRGDSEAAHRLVLRILPRVQRQVRHIARGEDLADYCQEACLRILECLSSYRGEGRFEAWVDAITARVTLRGLIKRRTDLQRLAAASGLDLDLPEAARAPHRALAIGRALDAVAALAQPQQSAITMHYVLGMTVPEISTELGVPVETLRSRLKVGMGQVRAALGVLSTCSAEVG
jgi:RNA polymerase sigma-70 factor (ECF subfamily)